MLPACQSGYQHDEGGLRQMEVGDKGIQHLEAVARIDEDVGPAGTLGHGAVLGGKGLDGTAGGGTHTDDPTAVFLRLIDDVRRVSKKKIHGLAAKIKATFDAVGVQQ